MLAYTQHDLQNKTAELQELAKQSPVLIETGDMPQVLMSYDEYLKMGGEPKSPFVSAYAAYMSIMSDFPQEQLDALAESDVEFDMSFSEQN